MSTGDSFSNYPEAGNEIRWLGFFLRIEFHPSIKLSRKEGNEFAAAIYSAMEAGTTTTETNEWIIRGAGVHDGMQVVVTKNTIQLSVVEPSNVQDWYEQRFASILECFEERYDQKLVLSCNAMANGVVEVSGDARAFLGGSIMLMHPRKLTPMARPLHVLGVRLYFPPFEDEDDRQTDWGVDVKIESWIEDSEKLYVEADADWHETITWGDGTAEALASHISTVTDFIKDRVIKFLHQSPVSGIDFTEDDDGEELEGDENDDEE